MGDHFADHPQIWLAEERMLIEPRTIIIGIAIKKGTRLDYERFPGEPPRYFRRFWSRGCSVVEADKR
jgi:hypothetical protein